MIIPKVNMIIGVYHKKLSDRSFIYLLLYVDDMLIASHNKSSINDLKALLKSEFEMKDLAASKKILGMEIQRDLNADKLFLNQHSYIGKVLQCFNMKNCKRVNTPLTAHFKIFADHRRGVKILNTSPMYHILAHLGASCML